LPTFRGKDGIYGNGYKGESHPARILTMKYFRENPNQFWKWHYMAYHQINECKPNSGHFALLELQEQFKREGKSFSLIT
jgi:NAD-dependent deacetylase